MRWTMVAAAGLGILAAQPAASQAQSGTQQAQGMMLHQGMQHPGMEGMQGMMHDPNNPYAPAEMQMHHSMMQATGRDASEIWTRKMIEHHRGAIEMSRIALREAKDPETRAMAQEAIANQERDVGRLEDWLRRHGLSSQ